MDDSITVSQGAYLNGTFAIKPNTNNKVSQGLPSAARDLAIPRETWTSRSKWTIEESMRMSRKSSLTRCADPSSTEHPVACLHTHTPQHLRRLCSKKRASNVEIRSSRFRIRFEILQSINTVARLATFILHFRTRFAD